VLFLKTEKEVLVLKLVFKRFQIVTPCLEMKLSASLVLVFGAQSWFLFLVG
jgi:hypothetical protein